MILYAATAFASAFSFSWFNRFSPNIFLPGLAVAPESGTRPCYFSGFLTTGYACAHIVADRFSRRRQSAIMLAFLLLYHCAPADHPFESVGAPGYFSPFVAHPEDPFRQRRACYLLLSSTSPLLQSWFTHRRPGLLLTRSTPSPISARCSRLSAIHRH